MKRRLFITALIVFQATLVFGQTRTVGLFLNDTSKAFKGYTLFAPKQNTMTYLINNDSRIVHQWTASKYPPGQSVYLLENGHLLRTCMTQGNLGTGGGEGGRIEEYDWNDNLVWQLDYSTTTYMQHHDIKRLPNGNIIMLVVEKKTLTEIQAAGFDTSKFQEPDFRQKQILLPDAVVEIQPTLPVGGTVVWSWHVWDHLIQNHDATKANWGVPSAHPELVDAAGDGKNLPIFWNHMNSIDYNATFDQIALSVRGNSEFWIIDHSTTTAQAAGHLGGTGGKGGDLLYRWGNPITYGAGTASDEKLFQQHDAEWIKAGCPGAGDIMCFNNGVGRNYSTIDQITLPVDSKGNYTLVANKAFGPTNLTWTYQATPPTSLYGADISGAQRLPNGNTLINNGPSGAFIEVTATGTVVWKYINPVAAGGALTWSGTIPDDVSHPGEKMNSVFRTYRYAPDYAAFTGKTLTPGDFVEKYATDVDDAASQVPTSFELFQNYPNPFNPSTNFEFRVSSYGFVTLKVFDVLGREIATLVNEVRSPGIYTARWDASNVSAGVYFVRLTAGGSSQIRRAVLVK